MGIPPFRAIVNNVKVWLTQESEPDSLTDVQAESGVAVGDALLAEVETTFLKVSGEGGFAVDGDGADLKQAVVKGFDVVHAPGVVKGVVA